MDDVGLHLSQRRDAGRARSACAAVAMPRLLTVLSLVGTAAMLWVGGGIILHGLAEFGAGVVPHTIEHWGHDAGEAVRLGEGRGRVVCRGARLGCRRDCDRIGIVVAVCT